MKTYVLQQIKRNTSHRENVAKTFDDKLHHIKDVCSGFFSKSETVQQDLKAQLKQMSDQQQEWLDLIIKPKATHSVKIQVLEAQLKELESKRASQDGFYKDLFRKLIYAIEQHMPTVREQTTSTVESRMSEPHVRRGISRQGHQRVKTSMNFDNQQHKGLIELKYSGPTAPPVSTSLVPQSLRYSNQSALLPALPDEPKKPDYHSNDISVINEFAQQASITAPSQTQQSSDMMLLKRLLFLKASIDTNQ